MSEKQPPDPDPAPADEPAKKDEPSKAATGCGCLVLFLVVGGISGLINNLVGGDDDDEPSAEESSQAEPNASPTASSAENAAAERRALVGKAEELVLGGLPDIPVWAGTTARGTYVSAEEVCVDRVYGDGSNAGYVVVTIPGGSLGEPTDGMCANAEPSEEPSPDYEVPGEVADDPGLVTEADLGTAWPLTVPYGVLDCQTGEAGGIELQSVTLTGPDGAAFALNGTAQSQTDLPPIDGIWADDPDVLTRATIWGRSSWHRADLHGLSDRGETCALASLV